MTISEVILFIAILALTSVLTAVGVQLYFLLTELRVTVAKVNYAMDAAGDQYTNVVRPLQQIGSAMVTVKSSLKVFDAFTGWLNAPTDANAKPTVKE